MVKSPKDRYSDKEAQERFEQALRGGLKTPPSKPLKGMTPKRKKVQRKKSRD